MTTQLGNEATIKDIAQEFRDILEKIRIYTLNEPEYISAIQEFELELSEEASLQRILDENDSNNFAGIRDALQAFREKNDIQTKLARLQDLYVSIQAITLSNNEKLSGHTEVSQCVETINSQGNLVAAETIPTVIESVRTFLREQGRAGDNYPYNVFSTMTPTGNSSVHNEREGSYSAIYLDGNTWLSLDDVPETIPFPINNSMRILCLWVKKKPEDLVEWHNTGAFGSSIFGWGTPVLDQNWCSFGVIYQTDGTARVDLGHPRYDHVHSAAINDGRWHHVAVVFRNNETHLYLDGALVGINSIGSIQTTFNPAERNGQSGVFLGKYPYPGNDTKFKGYVAEIGIYRVGDQALVENQIRDSYNARNGELALNSLNTLDSNPLVAYYRFNEENTYNRITNTNPLTLKDGNLEFVSTDLTN